MYFSILAFVPLLYHIMARYILYLSQEVSFYRSESISTFDFLFGMIGKFNPKILSATDLFEGWYLHLPADLHDWILISILF